MPTIHVFGSKRSAICVTKWACPKITSGQRIWHKAHRCCRRIVQSYPPGGVNVSFHNCTLAPPGEYNWTCASFGLPQSTTQTANRSVQPFLHRSRKIVVGQIGATWWIRLNLCILRSTWVHNQDRKSIGSAVFAQLTTESAYTLQLAPLSTRIAPSHEGIWTPWFLGPTPVLNANGISIASCVFVGLSSAADWQTDRETDRPRYSIGNNRPHVLTAIWRNSA